MILTETEKFTAEEAAKAGLISAIEKGTTKIEGYYELTPDGIKFDQKKFVFFDIFNNLRVGVFATDGDLAKFGKYLENE